MSDRSFRFILNSLIWGVVITYIDQTTVGGLISFGTLSSFTLLSFTLAVWCWDEDKK